MTLQFAAFTPAGQNNIGYGAGRVALAGAGRSTGFASGGARVVVLGFGRGAVTSLPGVPITPSAGGGQLNTRIDGVGFDRLFGAGGGGRIGMRGAGIGSGLSLGGGRIGVAGEGQEVPLPLNYAFYLKAPPIMQGFANYAYTATREGVTLSSLAGRIYAALVRSVARMQATERAPWAGTKRVRDVLATADGLSWVRQVMLAEGLVLGTEVVANSRAMGRVISRLILQDAASNYAEAMALITEALTLISFDRALLLALVADDVELESQLASRYLQIAAVLEQLVLQATEVGEYQMVVLVDDAVLLDQIAANQVDMVALLRDSIGLTLSLSFDDGQHIAWVINTESGGLSRYVNYPFNSFMRIGNRYYGVHHGGVVELVGDTDAGEKIAAHLRFGMFDFNDRHEKTYSDAFLGVAANGDLILKVIFVGNRGASAGEKSMAIYKVNYRPSASQRETRAKLGRGVQAVEFDFVLENIDGADFDLNNIQFNPVVGSRRTRG